MLNQAAVEALYSATYVETYLDCMDNLPDDMQRHFSRMRELDVTYQAYLKEVEHHIDVTRRDSDSNTRRRTQVRVEQALIAAQEVGDEKLQVIQQIQDLVENKARQLDLDYRNLDFGKDQENTEPNKETHHHHNVSNVRESGTTSTSSGAGSGERQSKRARRTRVDTLTTIEPVVPPEVIVTPEPVITRGVTAASTVTTNTTNNTKKGSTGKKKKRKSRQSQQQQQQQQQQREESPPREDELAIDPDEPTYCLCDQISYGEMILCDNDLCPIEWFHFSCVNLATKPKGKWFCPKCRGDRPNTMKPKAQFLKELERYNKEKEEKA